LKYLILQLFFSLAYFSKDIFATGGFPIRSFSYPGPAMGNDHVPPQMCGGFALNALFWLFVCSFLFQFFPEKYKSEKIRRIIFC